MFNFFGGTINTNLLKLYKMDMSKYKFALAEYQQQETAFNDLIVFIQKTLVAYNIVFIQEAESHPWNIL